MSKPKRLSAEERRLSILGAAIPLFASRGFRGTTTKEIARAANVSEALLYRHFPSKDAIYQELKNICCGEKEAFSLYIDQLEPSSSTLIHIIYFMLAAIYLGEPDDHGLVGHQNVHRLMANSCLEDGEFARLFLRENVRVWEPILNKSIEAAIESGDMIAEWMPATCRWWLAHHIAVTLGFMNLPTEQVIDYGVDPRELLEFAVRFSLRGMGMKDEALTRLYDSEKINEFLRNMFQSQA